MKEKSFEDLAAMTKKGFDEMTDGFNAVNKHFDNIDNRLDNLELGHEDIK